MSASLRFAPNGARAAELDRVVRERLATSLRPILDGFVSQGAAGAAAAEQLLQTIAAGPVRPAVFGLYSALVDAIFADDAAQAERRLHALLQLEPAPALPGDGPRMVTLDEALIGPGQVDLYARLANDETTDPAPIERVGSSGLRSAGALGQATLSLLEDCAPALAEELRNLIREIVFVRSEPDGARPAFQGASTFYLWGAMFLNAARHANRVDMAKGMAHEGAHSLLFGFTLGAPLVENDPEERFASPLRDDPRPMDGVVHATFVLARMEYCMQQLIRSRRLSDEERSLALDQSRHNQASFRDGAEVVAKHARFTAVGAALMEGASAYMDELMRSPAEAC